MYFKAIKGFKMDEWYRQMLFRDVQISTTTLLETMWSFQ